MSFFIYAGLARFALQRGNLALWYAALRLGGKGNLVPAEQLANAAASPNTDAWGTVSTVFDNALSDPIAVSRALYRSVERDNLWLMKELLTKWDAGYDTDTLLQAMARHGATDCWLYAITTLRLTPSVASHEALVDAAITCANGSILVSLQHTTRLAYAHRARIRCKRELDDQLRGGNIQYVQNVINASEWLKSIDYEAAQAFARSKASNYLLDFIHRRMDEADRAWGEYHQKQTLTTESFRYLKTAA